MEAKLKDRQAVEATIEVTVPAEEVDAAFDRVLNQLSRQVRVPGFRPGKAPRGVLLSRVGRETVEGEVREELIERSYPQAMRELELTPVHAHVHGGTPTEGQDFTFEFHVDLYPDFELPNLEEIVIDTEGRRVDDEMVAETVARLQREHATLVPVDRPIEASDYVLVETVGDDDSGSGSTMPIDLESVGDELASQLVGHAMGEVVELRLGGPEAQEGGSEADGEAAGSEDASGTAGADQPRSLRVLIKDVKAKEKPAADDELARTLGFDDWAETEDRIRTSIQAQLDQEAYEAQQEEFVEKLMAETSFELPGSLVRRRKGELLQNLAGDLSNRGMSLDRYFETLEEKGQRDEFESELQEAAERGVRRDIVLERLLEARGTTVSDAELNEALQHLASREGTDVARFVRERGEDWVNNYRFLLARNKALREAVRERVAAQAPDEAMGTPSAAETAGEDVGEQDADQ